MRRSRHAGSLLLMLTMVLALPGRPHAQDLESRVRVHQLGNGMVFLLLPRHISPTISFSMRFMAGGSDEAIGTGGTAHLLEHMLFKGTHSLGTRNWPAESQLLEKIDEVGAKLDSLRNGRELVNKDKDEDPDPEVSQLEAQLKALQDEATTYRIEDEISSIYSRAGEVGFNASTDQDLTTYTVSLPKNRLELWARIESDRMLEPVLRQYYSERDVVMEERRLRVDANPAGKLLEQFGAAAYQAHNYGQPVIGWASEIQQLSKARTEEFRKLHYAPNNSVTAIVGDFEIEVVVPILERYFGRIPPQPLPHPAKVAEPEQMGERRVVVEEDANPMIVMGFHKPTLPSREDYVFDVVTALLSEGRSSRLYKNLVRDKRMALSVDSFGGYPGTRYPNLFCILGLPRAPHTTAELEQAIQEELDRLKAEPVTERELTKVINNLEASFIRGLDSNSGLAGTLSYFQALAGDWRYVARHSKVIRTIKPEEVQAVAKKYLVRRNRTVAVLERPVPAEVPVPVAVESKSLPDGTNSSDPEENPEPKDSTAGTDEK